MQGLGGVRNQQLSGPTKDETCGNGRDISTGTLFNSVLIPWAEENKNTCAVLTPPSPPF